ncbi:hypothetical protein KOE80_04500 [Alcaligenes sp. 13f]|uniref:AtuA-related protein n=1 Tax=Alcaligenes sp. 13f TaxID=2841924 RepID=UPI001CF6F96B|nr:hypothetical protein [Alcaligenes sp. 13f]MCB4321465.1 hypothetical protein [Alcaligenes sp. 13f]
MSETSNTASVELYYLAHARSGDKGDTLSICVIPYEPQDYGLLAAQLQPEHVKEWMGDSVRGTVMRFDLPNLSAFNFVMHQALDGGVSDSLYLDAHGKTRSGVLLSMPIRVPDTHPAVALKKIMTT